MSFKNLDQRGNLFGANMRDALDPKQIVLWGRTKDISRDPAGGWLPLGNPGANIELVNIPRMGWDRPVLFTIDLLIVDVATGMAPDPALLPFPPYQNGGFRVLFGAGNDVREFLFQPGIHSMLGETLRIRAVPFAPPGFQVTWRYHAHCTVQEGVSPSYTVVGP